MNVTPDTPMHDITCAGLTLQAPAPYAEGHTLTSNEAAVLNQTLAENLRNNFATKVKKAKDALEEGQELDVDALNMEFAEYVESYEFGVRRSGGTRAPADPVEREALNIAKAQVRAALKKKGIKASDMEAAQITELATGVLDKYPQIREQAQQIVNARSAIGADELDLDV